METTAFGLTIIYILLKKLSHTQFTALKTLCANLHNLIVIYLSVGYTTSDVLYRWNSRAVVISDDLRMSQFDLIGVPSSNETFRVGSEKDEKTIGELMF